VLPREKSHTDWVRTQVNLGDALLTLGQLFDDLHAVAEALSPYQSALKEMTPEGGDDWSRTQLNFANALQLLGERTFDADAVAAAVTAYQLVLEHLSREDRPLDWAIVQRYLGHALFIAGEQTRDPATLRDAAAAYALALEELPREESTTTQADLGNVLARLAERTGDAAMARAAVSCHREALELLPPSDVEFAITQMNLGSALLILGTLSEDSQPLTEAVTAYRVAAAGLRNDRPILWARALVSLGNALREQGETEGDPSTVAAAVRSYRRALRVLSPGQYPVERARAHANLGNALRIYGEMIGAVGEVRKSVMSYRRALNVFSRASLPFEWATIEMNLGTALLRLGQMTGEVAPLRAAVAAYRLTLEEHRREHFPDAWAVAQVNLGTALATLGEMSGDVAVLGGAVDSFRLALDGLPRDRLPIEWGRAQMNLGNALRSRGERLGDATMVREAVTAVRQALSVIPFAARPAEWGRAQMNHGNALLTLGELTGDAGAMREAIAVCRLALSEGRRERVSFGWARTQINLGNMLMRLGEITGDIEVARQAVDVCQLALKAWRREDHLVDWATGQVNLGTALLTLGNLTNDRDTLQEAVDAYRSALAKLPQALLPADWATASMNLGVALLAIAALASDETMAREAIAAFQRARNVRSPERVPVDWAIATSNLSSALRTLAALKGDEDLAREAVAACELAVKVLPREQMPLDWAKAETNAGRAHHTVCSITQDRQDWSDLAIRETAFLDQLEQLCWTSESVAAQLAWSERATQAAIRLMESLIHLDRLGDAMAAAQRGLAVQLAIGLHVSDSVPGAAGVGLRQARREWQSACAAAEQVDIALARVSGDSTLSRLLVRRTEMQRWTQDAFAGLREAINAVPLKLPAPASAEHLRAVLPAGGALVLLVPRSSATAIFVIAAADALSAPPYYRELEGFTDADLALLLGTLQEGQSANAAPTPSSWLGAYAQFRRAVGSEGRVSSIAISRWNAAIEYCLGATWDKIMGPLDTLLRDEIGLVPGAEVALVPAGVLSLLPLHAARRPNRLDWRYFLQDWVVSYAPSPTAWLASRRRSLEPQRKGQRLLAITGVHGRNPALTATWNEGAEELSADDATPSAVMAALPWANYVSLYCHGVWNPTNPANSALVLGDALAAENDAALTSFDADRSSRLTVRELRQADLRASRLFFLWACESAMIGIRQSNEAIGFPGALVDAGVPGVVGSLWMVGEEATRELAELFLHAHLRDLSPAAALREAQIAMLGDAALLAGDGVPLLGRLGVEEPASAALAPIPLPRSAPFHWAGFTVTGA
jgi:tetratricopeptide (TPR) repeat protein